VLENTSGGRDGDTGSVDDVSLDQLPGLARPSNELLDNTHTKQLQYLQQRQWERRRAAELLSPRATASIPAAAAGPATGDTGGVQMRASSPYPSAPVASGEDSRECISGADPQYVRLGWGAADSLQEQHSLSSQLAAAAADGQAGFGASGTAEARWVHVAADHCTSPGRQQQQQGYQPKIIRAGSLGADHAGGNGIGSKRMQQQQQQRPRHSVASAQAGSFWQKGLRSPDPSPLRARKSPPQQQRHQRGSPQKQQRSPSLWQQQGGSPTRQQQQQQRRLQSVTARVDTSPPIAVKLPGSGRQPGCSRRGGGSYILQHERMLQESPAISDAATAGGGGGDAAVREKQSLQALAQGASKGLQRAEDACPAGLDRTIRTSCPASPAAAALQAAAAAAAAGGDHTPKATASRAAAKASRVQGSGSGGKASGQWRRQWQHQQQQQLGIKGLSTSCSWAEPTPEKLRMARIVSPQLGDSSSARNSDRSANKGAAGAAAGLRGSDVDLADVDGGSRWSHSAVAGQRAYSRSRDVDSLPLSAHCARQLQQYGQRDRLGGGASSSDDDDDVAGVGLRSSGSGVMSSAARQAALKQLQQYQKAWRWSQQEDRE
jgi:hypothetical protein